MSQKKKQADNKKEYAFRLFIGGETQKVIAKTIGVTEATVSRWAAEGQWQDKRDTQGLSTVELSNGLLRAAKRISDQIVKLIDEQSEEVNLDQIAKCSDSLVKIMASAERMSKSVTRANIIDVIIALDNWLMSRIGVDPDLSIETVRLISDYHQKYITFITQNND